MIDFQKLGLKYDESLADIYIEGERLYKDLGGYIFDKARILKLHNKYSIFRDNLTSILDTADIINADTQLSLYAYVLLAAINASRKISLDALPDFNSAKTDLLLIYPIFYFAEEMIENMQKRNLPFEIISDTLADFDCTLSAYSAFFGSCGARIYYDWLVPYVHGKMLRVGRFNIEIAKFRKGMAVYKSDNTITVCKEKSEHLQMPVLTDADDVLSIHIPANLPLNEEITEQSLSLAKDIFKNHYPEYNFKAFVCYSWLLNPMLKSIMGKDTNITRFASAFERFDINDTNGSDVYRFLYNMLQKPKSPKLLPENSSMQKNIKEFLCKGNIYSSFGGVILL